MAAASRSTASPKTTAKCGAKTRAGGKCKIAAGHGTEHVGAGRCKLHGGNTPNHQRSAAKELVLQLGAELEMEPHDAILLAVRKAAMWERFCASKVATLEDDDLVVTHEKHRDVSSGEGDSYTETTNAAQLTLWLKEHQQAVRDLAHLGKVAVDAGVAERQVRLAEQLIGDIAAVIRYMLDHLELTPKQKQRAPVVTREALKLIDGGMAA